MLVESPPALEEPDRPPATALSAKPLIPTPRSAAPNKYFEKDVFITTFPPDAPALENA
jgi:hypothetical protein